VLVGSGVCGNTYPRQLAELFAALQCTRTPAATSLLSSYQEK
jgi:hypothetical protein